MGKTDITTWVMGDEYILHECDNCNKLIEGTPFAHWAEKDFTLCFSCIYSFSDDKTAKEKNEFRPTKARIPSSVRWGIWNRDNFTCQYCGAKENLSIDHIYPETLGGGLEESNLVTACHSCNSSKGARTPEEAGIQLMFDPRR